MAIWKEFGIDGDNAHASVGDINGDGYNDIIESRFYDPGIDGDAGLVVYFGSSDGSFSERVIWGGGSHDNFSELAQDKNVKNPFKDGLSKTAGTSSPGIAWHWQDIDGLVIGDGIQVLLHRIADFNNDGKDDIFVVCVRYDFSVSGWDANDYYNNKDVYLWGVLYYDEANDGFDYALNGYYPILDVSSYFSLRLPIVRGEPHIITRPGVSHSIMDAEIGDIDGDGDIDVVMSISNTTGDYSYRPFFFRGIYSLSFEQVFRSYMDGGEYSILYF